MISLEITMKDIKISFIKFFDLKLKIKCFFLISPNIYFINGYFNNVKLKSESRSFQTQELELQTLELININT